MKCQKHNKDYQKLCTTCHMTPVCSECIDDGHSKHSLSSSTSVAKDEKARLLQFKTDNDKVISQLSSEKKKTEEQFKHRKKTPDNNEKEINVQRKHLHDLVDEVADDLIELYKSASKIYMDGLESQIKSLSSSLSDAEKYSTSVNVLLKEGDDFTVIQRAKDVQAIPQSTEIHTDLDTVTFKRRNVTRALVRNMFEWHGIDGEEVGTSEDDNFESKFPVLADKASSSDSMTEVASFKQSDQGVTFIRQSRQLCILKETRQDVLLLKWVDQNGHPQSIKSFNTIINGFTSTPDNRLFVCCYDKMEIQEVTLGSVRRVVSTSPLQPMDIGVTKTGQYLVTVRDDNTFTTTSKSIRGVIVFNKNWKEIARVIKDEQGRNIFVRPYKVSISSSGTIAILNMMSKFHCHLVVLKPDFSLKFRVIGEGKVVPKNKPLPDLATCDKYDVNDVVFHNDHMILYEGYSKSIQLLNEQGNVTRVLSKLETPVWSLCLDDKGQLWTGKQKGRVVVYKLQ